MTAQQRQLVTRGYKQEFDLREAAAPSLRSADTSTQLPKGVSEVSAKIEAAWSSDGGGRGGKDLDDIISGLGAAYVQGGRVVWDPPPGLHPTYMNYLSWSVEELNNRLQAGTLTIDEDGNIKAPGLRM
jgi:hypothetical protein